MSRRALSLLALTAIVLALGLLVRFGPGLAFSAALAAPRLEGWLVWVSRETVRETVSLRVESRSLEADLYRPADGTPRGAIVLVHGLSRAGRHHAELVRLARLLARERQLVLVPQLDGLAAFRLSGNEVADIRAGARYLARIGGGPVAVAGFSFGAGPALLAAADLPSLRVAGSFGGYADLRNVITYVTTGVFTFQGSGTSGSRKSTTGGSCSPCSSDSSRAPPIGRAWPRSPTASSPTRPRRRRTSSAGSATRGAR